MEKNRPCFKERIEAWTYGPVVPEAYREFKRYGSLEIPHVKTYFLVDKKDIFNSGIKQYDNTVIPSEDKQLIDEVVNDMSEYSTMALVKITHRQAPWKDAYKNNHGEITVDAIRRYFNEKNKKVS